MAKKKTPVEEVIENPTEDDILEDSVQTTPDLEQADNVPENEEVIEKVETNDGETIPAQTLEEKMDIIDKEFDSLEEKFLSGSTEQMNAQQNELLSLKIKIKRLF